MDTPSLTDGRRAIKDPIVENLNVLVSSAPVRYHFISHSLKIAGRLTPFELEGEGTILGFDVRSAGPKTGGIRLQLNKPTDAIPQAAHILRLTVGTRIEYYGVTEADDPEERNAPVRIAPTLHQMVNPVFKGLLSEGLGDTKQTTFSKLAGDTTIDPEPVNTRSAGTKAYSATQEDGSAIPAGLAINASTGVLSITAATIATGTYIIKVVVSDVLATLPTDHPYRTLEGEATLILTVTA